MGYLTRAGEKWYSTDDLTFAELEDIEKAAGVGWAFINPHRNIASARALLAVWLLREGRTETEVSAEISALTAKTLKHSFRFVDDDDTLPDGWEDGLPVVDPKDPAVT